MCTAYLLCTNTPCIGKCIIFKNTFLTSFIILKPYLINHIDRGMEPVRCLVTQWATASSLVGSQCSNRRKLTERHTTGGPEPCCQSPAAIVNVSLARRLLRASTLCIILHSSFQKSYSHIILLQILQKLDIMGRKVEKMYIKIQTRKNKDREG